MPKLQQFLYGVVTTVLRPVLGLYLRYRVTRGKEDPARLGERKGLSSRDKPSGPLVWVHGASVGEVQSALGLIDRILSRMPDAHVLVTSGTVTSANLMSDRLPPRAFHQYLPVDSRAWTERFLDHWKPDMVIWIESDLWPNMLRGIAQRAIPALLANGRMSERSFARWRRRASFAHGLLATFKNIFAQTEKDAERFRMLAGVDRVEVLGNLKLAAEPLPVDAEALAELQTSVIDRSVWVAASLHPGEVKHVAEAHKKAAMAQPNLLTILVPRHPERGQAFAAELEATGLQTALRSEQAEITDQTDCYIADTLGELGLFYRLSSLVFVGGSLVSHGGQNPLEPASLGCALFFGPHMENFSEIADALQNAGAAETVSDGHRLGARLSDLLADPVAHGNMAAAGMGATTKNRAVLDRIMGRLEPVFVKIDDRRSGQDAGT